MGLHPGGEGEGAGSRELTSLAAHLKWIEQTEQTEGEAVPPKHSQTAPPTGNQVFHRSLWGHFSLNHYRCPGELQLVV